MKIFQYLTHVTNFDAMSNNIIEIHHILRKSGYDSYVIADAHTYTGDVPIGRVNTEEFKNDDILIIHFGICSDLYDQFKDLPCKIMMIYHNVTPAKYFSFNDGEKYAEVVRARQQLGEILPYIKKAIAVSEYNAKDLLKYGYTDVEVLPLIRDLSLLPKGEDEHIKNELKKTTGIIFIGRVAPQKYHIDLVKSFYFYNKYFNPNSTLYIVGGFGTNEDVFINLKNTIAMLRLQDEVCITGKVDDIKMATYLKYSSVFLSMSEHEGFFVPGIESMYFGLPILAYYYGGAIADTVGTGGVYFTEKDYYKVAALLDKLVTDNELREKLKENQKEELKKFDPHILSKKLIELIEEVKHG